jgi:phage FluMu protein Com
MAIFRCNQCGHLREVTNNYIGKSVACPRCQHVNPIYETTEFISRLVERYLAQQQELKTLKQQIAPSETETNHATEHHSLAEIDIYNTTEIASSEQYEPILEWFQQHQIQLDVNQRAIDTTGFFDEVAMQLGNHYETLKVVSEQIKHIQQKGYVNVKLPIAKKSQKEIRAITQFCKSLHDYSFVAKYFYQKPEKIVRLTLQTAPAVVSFFNGEWMEWFVFMKLLEFFKEKERSVACLRSFSVIFPDEDHHELDVFFLINNQLPICIECKTGEFRQHIEKYVTLRKRLKLAKSQFLLCVLGLSQEHTQGLSSMYDITFVNEHNFLDYIERLITE